MLEKVTKIADICYPIEYQVDIQLLLDSTNELLARLGNPVNAAVRVWYVDPTKMLHTFINASDHTRLHLLLTSCID